MDQRYSSTSLGADGNDHHSVADELPENFYVPPNNQLASVVAKSSTRSHDFTGHQLLQDTSQPSRTFVEAARERVPQSRSNIPSRGQVSPTKVATRSYAQQQRPDRGSHRTKNNFPRVKPLNAPVNTQKEEQHLNRFITNQSTHSLRERPEEPYVSSLKGIFLWPSNDTEKDSIRIVDNELDKIRQEYACHIVLEHNPDRLCIYDTNKERNEVTGDVLQAVTNLVKDLFSRASRCLRFIVALPPWDARNSCVQIIPARAEGNASSEIAGPEHLNSKIAVLQPLPAEIECLSEDDTAQISKKNDLVLERSLASCLGRLRSSPGRVEIKVLIGCFVFSSVGVAQNNSGERVTTLPNFLQKLRDTKSKGTLLRLGPGGNLFERAVLRTDILAAFVEGRAIPLRDVKPTYLGVFEFPSRGSQGTAGGQYTIETSSVYDDDGKPNVLGREWTCEHLGSRRLEAYVANLEGGLSWKLEVTSQPFHDKIPDAIRRFHTTVEPRRRTNASSYPGSTELMFRFDPRDPGPSKFHQRTQWKFYIKQNKNYILQVSRCDYFKLSMAQASKIDLSSAERQPIATEWEASIYDERWDDILGQNATLKAGERVNWDYSVARFFPSECVEEEGGIKSEFTNFASCANEICRGISQAKPW